MPHDENGKLIPDNTPVEVPLRFKQRETEAERIARMVTTEFTQQATKNGFETIEESMDFDVPDEDDVLTSQFETAAEMLEEFLDEGIMPEDELENLGKTPEELAIEEHDDGKKKQPQTEKNEREVSTEPASNAAS